MNLISATFALFVLAVLLVYYLLPRKSQNLLLLAASYLFYFSISFRFPVILAITTVITWLFAKQLYLKRKHRNSFFIFGIAFNLAILILFKVHRFFVPEILSKLDGFGWRSQTLGLHVLIPVGVSFYILQAISFLVDSYRKQQKQLPKLTDFALYLAYFPKLTAGPIERPGVFLPQLMEKRIVNNEKISRAFTLLLIGLIRKIVVADPILAAIPANIFRNPEMYTAAQLIFTTVIFILGLYFDFSGYTDIVRGISGFFGIELSPNFRWPLFSRSFSDFWNRWHISLSHWLRDNIFYPMSRMFLKRNHNPNNWKTIFIPPVATMVISGFWHGTAPHFLLWGLLMGLLIAAERLLYLRRSPVHRRPSGTFRAAFSIFFTIVFLLFCSVPFMVPVAGIKPYIQTISGFGGFAEANFRIALFLIPGLFIDWIQFRSENELVFLEWPAGIRVFVTAFAFFVIIAMTQVYVPAAFIYQGF
ncbi:MAG: MBOAT family protein [Acidobacteria bacterium]|nr:MBOAT family protein [Acidobacteriota bacterium]